MHERIEQQAKECRFGKEMFACENLEYENASSFDGNAGLSFAIELADSNSTKSSERLRERPMLLAD